MVLQPFEIDCVIYHHPCSDGFGAAYCAWKYFKINHPDKDVKYIPMNIGDLPPDNLEGKNLLLLDYSYKKDVIIQLLKVVNKLLIIDHHKSAQEDLYDISDEYKIFDMNYSGAMLAWFYFFPNEKCPLMIEYIQDRDIWTLQLPKIDQFTAWFYTLPFDFELYDMYTDDQLLLTMIDTKGELFHELIKLLKGV